jgi:hypothetical protein
VLSRLPGSITAVKRRVTACFVGNRPRGLGGAIYLLIRLLVRLFVHQYKKLLMLSFGGQGMLSNAMHLCWIV